MKRLNNHTDFLQESTNWLKAVIYLFRSGIFLTVTFVDVLLLFIGLIYKDLQFSKEFYLLVIVIGLLVSAIKVVKEKIIAGPVLKLSIQSFDEREPGKTEFFPIRWELQKIGSIVTRYNVFMKNDGSVANLPFIVIKKTKLDKHAISVATAEGSLETKGEDSLRITYQQIGVLMKNESIHIATLSFFVTSKTKTKPGDFFELPITFGAMDTKDKEARWKFRYEKQEKN